MRRATRSSRPRWPPAPPSAWAMTPPASGTSAPTASTGPARPRSRPSVSGPAMKSPRTPPRTRSTWATSSRRPSSMPRWPRRWTPS